MLVSVDTAPYAETFVLAGGAAGVEDGAGGAGQSGQLTQLLVVAERVAVSLARKWCGQLRERGREPPVRCCSGRGEVSGWPRHHRVTPDNHGQVGS